MKRTAILRRPGVFGALFALLLMSTAVLADSWYVLPKHDQSADIAYAPPNSTDGGEPYPSLDQALAAIGSERPVSTIDLGYVLNGDLLGMQEDIRSLMASTYPSEYAMLLRSRPTPAAWRGQPLRAKLHAAVLRSKIIAEISPVLEQHCLNVADVSIEKQIVTLRSGIPHFTSFIWIELARCSRQVHGAA